MADEQSGHDENADERAVKACVRAAALDERAKARSAALAQRTADRQAAMAQRAMDRINIREQGR